MALSTWIRTLASLQDFVTPLFGMFKETPFLRSMASLQDFVTPLFGMFKETPFLRSKCLMLMPLLAMMLSSDSTKSRMPHAFTILEGRHVTFTFHWVPILCPT